MSTTLKKKPVTHAQRAEQKNWLYSNATIVPEMALYYGFTPLLFPPRLEKHDEAVVANLEDRFGGLFNVKTKIALLRHYFAGNPNAGPFAFISEGRVPAHPPLGASADVGPFVEYHLDIIGTPRPTAEALLIKLCYEVARETWGGNIAVDINSVGERESFSRFSRDTGAHFKKSLADIDPDCRQAFKKSQLAPLFCRHTTCQTARNTMPESLGFLSEPSRAHFMNVLEHLEETGIPYTMDKELIVEPDIVQHTIFRVSGILEGAEQPGSVVVARGSRWGGLAKKMGFKKDVLSASAVIWAPRQKGKNKNLKKMAAPIFYLVHIGDNALRKSLGVIEQLRRAKINVYHALLKDKLAAQLGTAEHMDVPYVLIMGQKESVDGTLIVRELASRSQETVPLMRVAEHLRKLV